VVVGHLVSRPSASIHLAFAAVCAFLRVYDSYRVEMHKLAG
jgi:hypothetical protein